MISKAAALAISQLFQMVRLQTRAAKLPAQIMMATGTGPRLGERPLGEEQYRMMAGQLEAQRLQTAEAIAKQQNLDRMRAHTQAQLGIGLAEQGMGHNPMLGGGGGGADSAPFVAWSARRG